MAGYLNRFIDLPFPELAGVDNQGRALCWIKIRNPRLMPAQDLTDAASKVRVEDGKAVSADLGSSDVFTSFAKLVIAGRVWDATAIPPVDPDTGDVDEEWEPPLLAMPPTAADMGKMPIDIINAIGGEMKNAVPR